MDTLYVFGAKYLFVLVGLGAAGAIFLLPKSAWKNYLLTAILAGVLAILLTQLAGILYFDPRPFTQGVRSLIPHAADNGFPSDHTVLSFTAALLTYPLSRPLFFLLLILAIFVAISRVAVGVHHPIDVLAGVVIGLLSYLLAIWLVPRVEDLGAKTQ